MTHMNRRGFLQSTLVGAGVAISGTKASGRIVGANDTVRIAVAGLNGRGKEHVDAFARIPGVEIAYLVDPDRRTFEPRLKQLREKSRSEPKCVQDIRQVLEAKDVDAVTIATPNHWHSLMTVWACQAGKDVYVEKPCSHEVIEGQRCVEAAQKYKRIVQHGTQRRGEKRYQQLAEVVRRGDYGPLRVSRGIVYKLRKSIGTAPATTPPSEVDFDLWLGPAASRPFHTNLVHYNWHWFWDFGNGDIGNQGVHQMDVARWMIPGATLPTSVVSLGGRFGYVDQGETPNTQLTLFDFGPTKLIFEVRGLPTKNYPGDDKNEGSVLHFDDGRIANFNFYRNGQKEGEPIPQAESKDFAKPGGGDIFANFIACVRSRKESDLMAHISDGHYSSALCHLANVSYRLGEAVPFRPRPAFGSGDAVRETVERMEEHLGESAKLNFDSAKLRLGKKLQVNSATGMVVDEPRAEALLTRNYRRPFVVPDQV